LPPAGANVLDLTASAPEDGFMAKSSPPRPPSGLSGGKPTIAGEAGHAERCAFCGRREIEAGRLITGAKAAICADCIRKLGQGLKGSSRSPRR
jgi:ClpX C4-type zinc finger